MSMLSMILSLISPADEHPHSNTLFMVLVTKYVYGGIDKFLYRKLDVYRGIKYIKIRIYVSMA